MPAVSAGMTSRTHGGAAEQVNAGLDEWTSLNHA